MTDGSYPKYHLELNKKRITRNLPDFILMDAVHSTYLFLVIILCLKIEIGFFP